MNIEGTAFQNCGTLAHREELSENTRGTAGMLVSSSGVKRKQDEHRRNSFLELRNARSQRRTVREHSRNDEHRRNSFLELRNARSQRRTVREHSRNGWNASGVKRKQDEHRRNGFLEL